MTELYKDMQNVKLSLLTALSKVRKQNADTILPLALEGEIKKIIKAIDAQENLIDVEPTNTVHLKKSQIDLDDIDSGWREPFICGQDLRHMNLGDSYLNLNLKWNENPSIADILQNYLKANKGKVICKECKKEYMKKRLEKDE